MKKLRKSVIMLAAMLTMIIFIAVPASAKTSSAYKKAYKNFLSKGTFTYTESRRTHNSYGKWYTEKYTYYVKVNSFALVNIDKKGQPELILFSKVYPGTDKSGEYKSYYDVYVARMSGKKVKLASFGTNKTLKGSASDKAYTTKVYGLGESYYDSDDKTWSYWDFIFNFKYGGGIRYDSTNKALVVSDGYKRDYGGGEVYTGVSSYFYKYSGGKMTYTGVKVTYNNTYDGDSYTGSYTSTPTDAEAPAYITNYSTSTSKAVKLYTNNKSNRSKLGKGKIKIVK